MSTKQTFRDKCFKDETGKVVLTQTPNLPLSTWLICTVLGLFIETGRISDFLNVLGFGALFTFAWLELFDGVNYIRRFFGLLVLMYIIYSRVF